MTTSKLIRWNPWREMQAAATQLDRLFEEGELVHPLALDAYVTEDEIIITASVPGIDPAHLSINIEDNVLTIRGALETSLNRDGGGDQGRGDQGRYVMRERRYGNFERSLRLGVAVDVEKAEAYFDKGVLTLTLPKAPEAKPQQIPVRTFSAN